MKKIILGVVMVLGVWVSGVWADTHLVSTAGTDAGTCLVSACLTINYAQGQATAGDVISVAAGTYTENSGAGRLTITKAVTISPVGTVTIRAASSSPVITVTPAADGTYTFGGSSGTLILDAQGTYTRCMVWTDTANNASTIALNNVTFHDFTLSGMTFSETSGSLTATNVTLDTSIDQAGDLYGFNLEPSGGMVAGTLVWNGLTVTMANTNATNGGIRTIGVIGSAGTTATVSVAGVNGSITTSGSGANCNGVRINGIPNTLIDNGLTKTLTVTSASTTADSDGFMITATAAGTSGSGGIIRNTKVIFAADTGHAITIGNTTTTTENLTNNGKIYNCSATRTNLSQTATPHGVCLYLNQGGEMYNNLSSGFAPDFILSQTDATTRVHHNIAKKPYSKVLEAAFYAKGVAGSLFDNNTVIGEAGFVGYQFGTVAQGAVNSAGVVWKNNIGYSTGDSTPFVYVAAAQTATFSNNGYFSTGVAAEHPFTYQASSYHNWAEWKAAEGANDTFNADPKLTASYALQPSSPARNAGTDLCATLVTASDYWGYAVCAAGSFVGFGAAPDIGANEFHFGAPSGGGWPTGGGMMLRNVGR